MRGPRRRRCFVTVICDVVRGQLLDVVEGRGWAEPLAWLQAQGSEWLAGVETGTLDLSATYRSVFETATPSATLVADPFHVVRHATSKLDDCRRRVQQETLGHRGRKHDALYRARRLLTMAEERLDDEGRAKLLELLGTGDKGGDVTATWHAKEAVRELYAHADEATAADWIDELIEAMAESSTSEVRSLGRTLQNWRDEIIAWHATHVSNGPTEALNNLAKRVKRVAFGFRSFRNYRVRTLLYAGRPDWSALAGLAPSADEADPARLDGIWLHEHPRARGLAAAPTPRVPLEDAGPPERRELGGVLTHESAIEFAGPAARRARHRHLERLERDAHRAEPAVHVEEADPVNRDQHLQHLFFVGRDLRRQLGALAHVANLRRQAPGDPKCPFGIVMRLPHLVQA